MSGAHVTYSRPVATGCPSITHSLTHSPPLGGLLPHSIAQPHRSHTTRTPWHDLIIYHFVPLLFLHPPLLPSSPPSSLQLQRDGFPVGEGSSQTHGLHIPPLQDNWNLDTWEVRGHTLVSQPTLLLTVESSPSPDGRCGRKEEVGGRGGGERCEREGRGNKGSSEREGEVRHFS